MNTFLVHDGLKMLHFDVGKIVEQLKSHFAAVHSSFVVDQVQF